jgi:hypothetical protein
MTRHNGIIQLLHGVDPLLDATRLPYIRIITGKGMQTKHIACVEEGQEALQYFRKADLVNADEAAYLEERIRVTLAPQNTYRDLYSLFAGHYRPGTVNPEQFSFQICSLKDCLPVEKFPHGDITMFGRVLVPNVGTISYAYHQLTKLVEQQHLMPGHVYYYMQELLRNNIPVDGKKQKELWEKLAPEEREQYERMTTEPPLIVILG